MRKLILQALLVLAVASQASAFTLPFGQDKRLDDVGIYGISGKEVYSTTVTHTTPELMGGDVYLRYLASAQDPEQMFKDNATCGGFEETDGPTAARAKQKIEKEENRAPGDHYIAAQKRAMRERVAYGNARNREYARDKSYDHEAVYICKYSSRLNAYVREDQPAFSGVPIEYSETAKISVQEGYEHTMIVRIDVSGTDIGSQGKPITRPLDQTVVVYQPKYGRLVGATRDLIFGLNEVQHPLLKTKAKENGLFQRVGDLVLLKRSGTVDPDVYDPNFNNLDEACSGTTMYKDQTVRYDDCSLSGQSAPGPDYIFTPIAGYRVTIETGLSPEKLAQAVLNLRAKINRPVVTKHARFRPTQSDWLLQNVPGMYAGLTYIFNDRAECVTGGQISTKKDEDGDAIIDETPVSGTNKAGYEFKATTSIGINGNGKPVTSVCTTAPDRHSTRMPGYWKSRFTFRDIITDLNYR